MSEDVSRETTGAETHLYSPGHLNIEREKPQQMYDPATKTTRPITVEYRADGCVTWREGS